MFPSGVLFCRVWKGIIRNISLFTPDFSLNQSCLALLNRSWFGPFVSSSMFLTSSSIKASSLWKVDFMSPSIWLNRYFYFSDSADVGIAAGRRILLGNSGMLYTANQWARIASSAGNQFREINSNCFFTYMGQYILGDRRKVYEYMAATWTHKMENRMCRWKHPPQKLLLVGKPGTVEKIIDIT